MKYNISVFDGLTIKDKLTTLKILEDTTDDIFSIHKEVYAFVNTKGQIKLINTNTMEVMEDYYTIKRIQEGILIMHHRESEIDISHLDKERTLIIDLNTFEILLDIDKVLDIIGDLLFNLREDLFGNELNKVAIYDIQGNKLYETEAGFSINMVRFGKTNMYMMTYKQAQCKNDSLTTVDLGEVLRYNKENKKCYRVAILNNPIYNVISDTHVIFKNEKENCNSVVIDMQKIEAGNSSELSKLFNILAVSHIKN